jgi:long-chain acyl-CoA synthetase
VGRPIPGTEVRIAEDGEILIRGPQVMKGYYRNDEATRATIDGEGWLSTGDIGALDADGFLRITDRKKQLIKTAGGKYIAPQPIENATKHSGLIAESVVIGDRRPYAILMVVPDFAALEAWAKGEGITWHDRSALVRSPRVRAKLEAEAFSQLGDFARYERPKKVLALARELSLDEGEITPSLKVKRRVVEDHFRAEIEALYAEAGPGDVS